MPWLLLNVELELELELGSAALWVTLAWCVTCSAAQLLISMKMLCGLMQIWQTEQDENDALNRHGIELNFHPAGNIFRSPKPKTSPTPF